MSDVDVRLPQHGRDHRVILVDGAVVNAGSDYIPGLADVLNSSRIVRGAIQNDAVVIAGTGFTAEWNDEDLSSPGANLYTIRFDTPFADLGPIVSLTANNDNPAGSEGGYGVSLKTRDPDFIVVETTEFDGTPLDGGFDFLAVEAAT